MRPDSDDYDSPWKEALERYFARFVEFFFPDAFADVDWQRGYEFLDQELQQVVRDAEAGRRLVDKLARVWRKGGEEAWVLVHIEIQGQVDADFPRRMYVYNYRLFDRYSRQVASLAVLGDTQPAWRPDSYGYELWGCRAGLRFPVVKLLDYEADWQDLERNANPFAVLVMAHLKTQATQRQPETRLQWKLRVIKNLYERGYGREDVLELFRVIDWMMALPPALARSFQNTLHEYEEEQKMPYVTSIERLGRLQGMREAMLYVLTERFEQVPDAIRDRISGIDDPERLLSLNRQAGSVDSLAEFQQALGQ